MPENSPKLYTFGLETVIPALPTECQNEPCKNIGHILSITALSISKISHLLLVTQTTISNDLSQSECGSTIGCTTNSTPPRVHPLEARCATRCTMHYKPVVGVQLAPHPICRCTGVGVHPHRVVHPVSLWGFSYLRGQSHHS